MLTKFKGTWNGHFGSISSVQRRIDLQKTNNRPTKSARKLAGPEMREIEKPGVNRMFAMNVIEPN